MSAMPAPLKRNPWGRLAPRPEIANAASAFATRCSPEIIGRTAALFRGARADEKAPPNGITERGESTV